MDAYVKAPNSAGVPAWSTDHAVSPSSLRLPFAWSSRSVLPRSSSGECAKKRVRRASRSKRGTNWSAVCGKTRRPTATRRGHQSRGPSLTVGHEQEKVI